MLQRRICSKMLLAVMVILSAQGSLLSTKGSVDDIKSSLIALSTTNTEKLQGNFNDPLKVLDSKLESSKMLDEKQKSSLPLKNIPDKQKSKSKLSLMASGSAPVPYVMKPQSKAVKPKTMTRKHYVSIKETKGTAVTPASGKDLKVSASVNTEMRARQLMAPSSNYYQRPIYDYNDHGTSNYGSAKIEKFVPSRSRFTNGHTSPGSYHRGDHHSSGYEDAYTDEAGHQGSDGYDASAGYEDDSYGNHDSGAVQSSHDVGGELVSSHIDEENYGGHHEAGAVGEAGHENGEKGYHSKGHSEDGFKNLHRKVEYGYTETFGDESDVESYDGEHDFLDSFHDVGEGGGYSGGRAEDHHEHDNYGHSGSRDETTFDENFERIKSSFANDFDSSNFDSHGDKHRSHGGSYNGFDDFGGYGDFRGGNDHRRHDSFPHSGAIDAVDFGFESGFDSSPIGKIRHFNAHVDYEPRDVTKLVPEYGPHELFGSRGPLYRGDIV